MKHLKQNLHSKLVFSLRYPYEISLL
jgi:hypothetical protein